MDLTKRELEILSRSLNTAILQWDGILEEYSHPSLYGVLLNVRNEYVETLYKVDDAYERLKHE